MAELKDEPNVEVKQEPMEEVPMTNVPTMDPIPMQIVSSRNRMVPNYFPSYNYARSQWEKVLNCAIEIRHVPTLREDSNVNSVIMPLIRQVT